MDDSANFACLNQPSAAALNQYQSHSTGEAHVKGFVLNETGNSWQFILRVGVLYNEAWRSNRRPRYLPYSYEQAAILQATFAPRWSLCNELTGAMFTLRLPLKSEGLTPLTLMMAAKVTYNSGDCHKFLKRIPKLPAASFYFWWTRKAYFSVCKNLLKVRDCDSCITITGRNSCQGWDEKTTQKMKWQVRLCNLSRTVCLWSL